MVLSKSVLLCFVVIFNIISIVNTKPGVEVPYTLYSREDWGGVTPTRVRPLQTPVPYVIIHHTYVPGACNNTEECAAAMRSMQNYHISLKWGDVGYQFCVGSQGEVYEGRGWQTFGIHARQANKFSIGICLIGDWRVDQPPEKMLRATQALIDTGVRNGAISPDYKLMGHSQVVATECPGTALLDVISKWDHFSEGRFTKKSN